MFPWPLKISLPHKQAELYSCPMCISLPLTQSKCLTLRQHSYIQYLRFSNQSLSWKKRYTIKSISSAPSWALWRRNRKQFAVTPLMAISFVASLNPWWEIHTIQGTNIMASMLCDSKVILSWTFLTVVAAWNVFLMYPCKVHSREYKLRCTCIFIPLCLVIYTSCGMCQWVVNTTVALQDLTDTSLAAN